MIEAEELRNKHLGCGVKKIRPDFIVRDRFVAIFMDLGFRIKRKKNYKRTGYANKKFSCIGYDFDNLKY